MARHSDPAQEAYENLGRHFGRLNLSPPSKDEFFNDPLRFWTIVRVRNPRAFIATLFADLAVGDHFVWGGKEHVKLPEIGSGPIKPEGNCYYGFVNCIQVGTCQLSGMGPLVEVDRIHELLAA